MELGNGHIWWQSSSYFAFDSVLNVPSQKSEKQGQNKTKSPTVCLLKTPMAHPIPSGSKCTTSEVFPEPALSACSQ